MYKIAEKPRIETLFNFALETYETQPFRMLFICRADLASPITPQPAS